ncbi:MAG: hypothetical protein K2Q25_11915, partial [Mycobacteriaceae bacterium]|nr:hypothetical protein [Mycobacteriaceae bacterium]
QRRPDALQIRRNSRKQLRRNIHKIHLAPRRTQMDTGDITGQPTPGNRFRSVAPQRLPFGLIRKKKQRVMKIFLKGR